MDIDIDLKTDFTVEQYFNNIVIASMVQDNQLKKHPAGVYFQPIPKDQITSLSAIPYESAEELGYIKIDFLHLTLLNDIQSKKQLRFLIKKEPNWALLEDENIVTKLSQISKHFEIIGKIKSKSVMELADAIALIRPAKRHLFDEYLINKEDTRKILYTKPEKGYYFKKGHAIAYALNIVVQLHLLEGINK